MLNYDFNIIIVTWSRFTVIIGRIRPKWPFDPIYQNLIQMKPQCMTL